MTTRNELPSCQLCGLAPLSVPHAIETQSRWNAMKPLPEAASPAALDVQRLRKSLIELHRILDGGRPNAEQIAAEYARLSPSEGSGTDV